MTGGERRRHSDSHCSVRFCLDIRRPAFDGESPILPQLSDGFFAGLLIIPMLAIIILAHEFGHFFAARSVGIKVDEFGIGIPPRARGWRWRGVLWSLNWIPLGGFVRVKGEDGQDVEPGSMNTKGPIARAFFLVAGSGANFIAAIVLSIILVASQGVPSDESHVYIHQVSPGSPAEAAGWRPGDVVAEADGAAIVDRDELSRVLDSTTGTEIDIVVRRGDELMLTTVVPRENPPKRQGATGITIDEAYLSSVKIGAIDAGSPADDAGWQSGDEIVAIDGVPIESVAQVNALLGAADGGSVDLTLHREGDRVQSQVAMPEAAIEVTDVAPDSPASESLLYAGDEIVSIGTTDVVDSETLLAALEQAAGTDVSFTVQREGRSVEVMLPVPEIGPEENPLAAIGVNAQVAPWTQLLGVSTKSSRQFDAVPAGEVIPKGFDQFTFLLTGTIGGIVDTFTTTPDSDNFAGPVGMGQLTSELITESALPVWFTVMNIVMVISVGLGLLNLLPLPALDGGRLVFVIVEILRGGKRIPPEKEGLVHLAGLALLLMLMFFVAFNDVSRLVDGDTILP